MNDPHSNMFAHISLALETLSPRDLHWLASSIMMFGAIIGLTSVDALDSTYASWALAGGVVGTGMAVLWRQRGERISIVAGRASCALVGGIAGPRIAAYWFPSLTQVSRDPVLLFTQGALCALLSFLLGYAVFAVVQRRQTRIAESAVKRVTGKETQQMTGE